MHCHDIRAALPAMLYDELNAPESQRVKDHLANCSVCKAEFTGLQQLAGLLDKLPVPPVRVDVARIFRDSQAQQQRGLRRWRRAALGIAGAAAALVLVMLFNLEVRIDGRQVVVRWGAAPQVDALPLPEIRNRPPEPETTQKPPEVTRADLRLLRELIHALAADVSGRDRQQQESLAELQGQLDRLERQAQERWAATVRYVAANARSDDQEKEGVSP